MVRELCVQWVPFFAPLRSMAASTSSMESRAWRLPRTIFCDPRRRLAGPRIDKAPPPRRDGSRAGPGPRPESQMQRLHKALPPRAHRCPDVARGARAGSHDQVLQRCAASAARGQHFQPCSHTAMRCCSSRRKRPRPEGRQHLPDALSEESRRLRVPRGRHGGPLQRKDERREGQQRAHGVRRRHVALHAGAGVVLAAAALRRRTRFEAGAAVEVGRRWSERESIHIRRARAARESLVLLRRHVGPREAVFMARD